MKSQDEYKKSVASVYYAHTTNNPDKSDWQYLRNHLTGVASLAQSFATDFNAGELAYTSGLLHDLGKYSPEFQQRLEGAHFSVDHTTAGAIEAVRFFGDPLRPIGLISAYVIAGHHGGLMNYGSPVEGLCERLRRKNLPDYSAFSSDIHLEPPKSLNFQLKAKRSSMGFCQSFFTRMLYSCIVDADSLDTENFCTPDKTSSRGHYDSFNDLNDRFAQRMQEINNGASESPINEMRKKIFDQCIEAGREKQGFFSLTVPTGGGKTLSSMAFALEHVKTHNLRRIFYVIPYTSIIEQNAKVFRDIFGVRNVLEHHSNFDSSSLDAEDRDTGSGALRLATENWDMPVIVTTNVQFFESLFSNKRSRTRKLHNLAKSVIILDEAQMLPTGYLLPCLAALSELVRNYGATVVICTATQPKVGDLMDKDLRPREIMISPSPDELYDSLKRVRVINLGSLNDTDLTTRLKENRQVLCIVNTRVHAKKLYDELRKTGCSYHLSARMCPAHRRKKIAEIKVLLKEGKDCRVISTQLIEAGVDIDFPVVYRAMTGIDSIAQAAGRCNREGRLPDKGEVFIFKSTEPHSRATSWQNRIAEVGEMALPESGDPLSLSTVADYFGKLYRYENLDAKNILKDIEERSGETAFPFQKTADDFQLIEGGTYDVIIPFGKKAREKIDELRNSDSPWRIARDLQVYSVNIYPNEFHEMVKMNAVETIADRFFVLKSCEDYTDETGLKLRQDAGYDGSLLIK